LSSHPVGIPIFQKSNIFAAENFAFWGSIGAARHHAVTASRLPSLVEKIIVFEIASPLTSKMSRARNDKLVFEISSDFVANGPPYNNVGEVSTSPFRLKPYLSLRNQ